jgi:hypothetical protein
VAIPGRHQRKEKIVRPLPRAIAAAVAAALLVGCQGAESPGGQEQPGPDTQLEEPQPNPGREGLKSPDVGSTVQPTP